MSKQLYENLLKKFKKANKARRLVIAGEAGYESAEEYQKYLESKINENKEVLIEEKKPVIYIIDILDCSTSMGNPARLDTKLYNAIDGINKGIRKLSENKEVEYQYGLVLFSTAYDYIFKKPSNNFNLIINSEITTGGSTALYDAIGKTLTELMNNVERDAKVLVNIYTDGEENSSRSYNSSSVEKLIKQSEDKGFTVTFVGTDRDVEMIQRNIKIHESNTLKYDGSAKGLSKATLDTLDARALYTASVLKGEDVKVNFYAKIKL